MPVMDGAEAATRIRRLETEHMHGEPGAMDAHAGRGARIIAMTAAALSALVKKYRFDILQKLLEEG